MPTLMVMVHDHRQVFVKGEFGLRADFAASLVDGGLGNSFRFHGLPITEAYFHIDGDAEVLTIRLHPQDDRVNGVDRLELVFDHDSNKPFYAVYSRLCACGAYQFRVRHSEADLTHTLSRIVVSYREVRLAESDGSQQ